MLLLKGFFTVPNDIPDERVETAKTEYIKKYVTSYENDGFTLFSDVMCRKGLPTTDDIVQGRSRWIMGAYWDRAPVKQTFEVDEKYIPNLIRTGKFSLA